MTAKKISELTAKIPSSADILPVADPSTGTAGKSTCNQIIASAAGFTSKTPAAGDWIPVADTATPSIAWRTRPYNICYVGLASWTKFTTYGSFAFQPYSVNISTNTNNLQIGVFGLVKLNCTVNSDLTGMVSENIQSNGLVIPGGSVTAPLDGQVVYLLNTGTNSVSIKSDDAASTAANRFLTHNGGNVALAANHMAIALYDTGVSRWRVWNLT
jgi:hypothetical protein